MHYLDHIILGVNDLGNGIAQFEDLTGVQPVAGGEHPELGTHNALASLGEQTYLEILAPRPNGKVVDWLQVLEEKSRLTPVMWVVGSEDLDETVVTLTGIGVELGEPVSGSRRTADQSILRWSLVRPTEPLLARSVFFIEWSRGSIHPSRTSPEGCSLVTLEIADPEPQRLRSLTDALGLSVAIYESSEPFIEVLLRGPNGIVRLPE